MNLDELKDLWQQALAANESGDFVLVTDICRKITVARPNFPQAWYLMAGLSVKFKQNIPAFDYLENAKPYIGENYDLQFGMARLYYQINEFEESKKLYFKLPGADESPTILLESARCLWRLGDFENALMLFNKANKLAEEIPEFAIPLIKAYLSFGDKENAQAICKASLEKHPEDKSLYLYYLMFLWDRGLHQQVIERLPKFPEDNPDDLNLFTGMVHLINKDPLEAEEFFHPLLQQDSYRAKIKGFSDIYDKNKQRTNILTTFSSDILLIAKNHAGEGAVYDFGVFSGHSTRILASIFPHKEIVGFDSFLGLPEQWTEAEGPGSLSLKGVAPKFNEKNVMIKKGWFKDTLPSYFNEFREQAALIHIDCDLYSSTKTALENAKSVMAPGTLIVLDDFFGYSGYEKHEIKAFNEFIEDNNVDCELIGVCFMGREVVYKIKQIGS